MDSARNSKHGRTRGQPATDGEPMHTEHYGDTFTDLSPPPGCPASGCMTPDTPR